VFSPGQWHKSVPKDKLANIKFRVGLLTEARDNRNIQRGLIEMCKRDILFFINAFVWQINPKDLESEIGPFISWEWQDEALLETMSRLFEDQDDILWEKSREMGATWLALIIAIWLCLFHDNKLVLCISHSEEAVDKAGKKGTLFAKIDFIMKYLPDWLKRRVRRRKLSFDFRGTSGIAGLASTGRSGVGDRAAFVLLDEFSKQQNAEDILGQTADTGPRLFIGTHYGIGTTYHTLTQRPDLRKIIMHWSQHPDKAKGLYKSGTRGGYEAIDKHYAFAPDYRFVTDGTPIGGARPGIRSPWYDKEVIRRKNVRDVAMHLDINPAGSVAQSFDPLTIMDLISNYARNPEWEGDLLYDIDAGLPDRLVARVGGPLKLWINPTYLGKVPLGKYGAACDLSQGSGATPSCLSLGNLDTNEKVGELITPRLDPKQFAVLVVAICRLFVDESGEGAELVWEIPGPGIFFGAKVLELGYRNLWKRVREDKLSDRVTESLGWNNTLDTKDDLLLQYRTALFARQFINPSEAALRQCDSFKFDPATGHESSSEERSPEDPSGARKNHGDRVITDAMLWLLMKAKERRPKQAMEQKIPYNSLAGRRQEVERRYREEVWA